MLFEILPVHVDFIGITLGVVVVLDALGFAGSALFLAAYKLSFGNRFWPLLFRAIKDGVVADERLLWVVLIFAFAVFAFIQLSGKQLRPLTSQDTRTSFVLAGFLVAGGLHGLLENFADVMRSFSPFSYIGRWLLLWVKIEFAQRLVSLFQELGRLLEALTWIG